MEQQKKKNGSCFKFYQLFLRKNQQYGSCIN
jgi:hypothetical protein